MSVYSITFRFFVNVCYCSTSEHYYHWSDATAVHWHGLHTGEDGSGTGRGGLPAGRLLLLQSSWVGAECMLTDGGQPAAAVAAAKADCCCPGWGP